MTILRTKLGDLKPIDFQPSIVGLDVIETPPEQSALMMAEFRAREAELARAHYKDADDMADFAGAKVWPSPRLSFFASALGQDADAASDESDLAWADTVPMTEGVGA